MFASKIQPQHQDQVDGGRLRTKGLGIMRKKDVSGNDSAYNTDDEGHLSDNSSMGKATPETNRRFWKLKKSKVKKPAITELLTGLAGMELQAPGQDHDRTPTNGDNYRRSYSSGDSSNSSEGDETGYMPFTVKLRAETSRANDCQMRLGQEIHTGLPKTSKPVYSVTFKGFDDEQHETTHLYKDCGSLEKYFLMKGPSTLEESPREPIPIKEEPSPDDGKPTPEEEPSAPEEEEGRRSDEVDASPKASSDEDKYPYRLARVELVNDTRVVAIHETDVNLKEDGKKDGKNVFSIKWMVTEREDKSFILCDPVSQGHTYKDLIMAVTTKTVGMVTMNQHPEEFQNPNTKIAIWSV